MGDVERNESVVRRFVEAGNRKEFDALDGLVAEGFVRHCQATPGVHVRSRDDLKRFLEEDARTFPDSEISIGFMFGEADLVAVHGTFSGTQKGALGPFPPSGARADVQVEALFRIEDGRIAELWTTWDNLAVLTQLGHLATPTVRD